MTELHADMTADGAGWRGEIRDHPSPVTWLVAVPLGASSLSLRLVWQPAEDCDPIPVGDGVLRPVAGGWHGEVSEFVGSWTLRGELPGRLLLWERAP